MHLKKHKYNISIRILIYNLIYFVKANCRAKMQTYVHVIVFGKHAENLYYICVFHVPQVSLVVHACIIHWSLYFLYVWAERICRLHFDLIYYILTMKTLDFSKTIFDFFVLPVFYRFCRCNIHVNDRDWKVYVKNDWSYY